MLYRMLLAQESGILGQFVVTKSQPRQQAGNFIYVLHEVYADHLMQSSRSTYTHYGYLVLIYSTVITGSAMLVYTVYG